MADQVVIVVDEENGLRATIHQGGRDLSEVFVDALDQGSQSKCVRTWVDE